MNYWEFLVNPLYVGYVAFDPPEGHWGIGIRGYADGISHRSVEDDSSRWPHYGGVLGCFMQRCGETRTIVRLRREE